MDFQKRGCGNELVFFFGWVGGVLVGGCEMIGRWWGGGEWG